MIKKIYILLFLCIAFFQKVDAGDFEYRQRKFDGDEIIDYKKNEDFRYFESQPYDPEEDLQDPDPNNGRRPNRENTTRPRRRPSATDTRSSSDSGGNILFYGIFGAVILALVTLLVTSKSGRMQQVEKNVPEELDEDYIEDINKVPFDSKIEQAVAAGDYRRAIRFLYLRTLKGLSDKKLITWEENKTNRDYYYEIKNRKVRARYEDLTYVYDYAWYGDLSISLEDYKTVEKHFKHFMKSIK